MSKKNKASIPTETLFLIIIFQCLSMFTKNLLHFSFRTPIFIYESCNLKSSYIYSYAIFISADAFVVK